jgi:hypothetical protein
MDCPNSVPEARPKEEKPVEKSYLAAAVESWGGSRSSTPKPTVTVTGEESGLKNQHGGYQHSQHGISLKRYPSDCPPLNVRWFYEVDVRTSPIILSEFGMSLICTY